MNTKRFLSTLLTLVMLLVCLPGTACMADEAERETFKSGDYTYALLDDGTVEITKYFGRAEELIIPDTLDGMTVTVIGSIAFFGGSFLVSVTIPDSVTSINGGAFSICSNLQSISVSPNHPNYTSIDGVLFRKDKVLIAYPAEKEGSSYTIPQGIVSIGDSAFSFCDSLTSVTIPDSVTSIGDYAFDSCPSTLTLTVSRNSYAENYAKSENIPYSYAHAKD